jgi:hypothetical protein
MRERQLLTIKETDVVADANREAIALSRRAKLPR